MIKTPNIKSNSPLAMHAPFGRFKHFNALTLRPKRFAALSAIIFYDGCISSGFTLRSAKLELQAKRLILSALKIKEMGSRKSTPQILIFLNQDFSDSSLSLKSHF